MVSLLTTPAAASEHEGVTPSLVAGDTRFDTAPEIARLTFDRARGADRRRA
jgi:hypothetical protein